MVKLALDPIAISSQRSWPEKTPGPKSSGTTKDPLRTATFRLVMAGPTCAPLVDAFHTVNFMLLVSVTTDPFLPSKPWYVKRVP